MRDSSQQEKVAKEFYRVFAHEGLTSRSIAAFHHVIRRYYREHGRAFPWRETTDPYHILVSEIMLQQTQTSRVIKKYGKFIAEFPDFISLARAPLRNVLQAWQGLGYNRRVLALHKIAQTVMSSFNGELPSSPNVLVKLPGIGHYTASAIGALAFNQPTIFIETNIRAVFLHFFFCDKSRITDRAILPLVKATLDKGNPREWYYGLFDYGAMLKRIENLATKSAHYRKQSPFKGSNRELRSQIVRLLLSQPHVSEAKLAHYLSQSQPRVKQSLEQLEREGMITIFQGMVRIK